MRSVLADARLAYFSIGTGKGDPESEYMAAGVSYLTKSERESQHLNCRKSRARDAALQAISSPLLECSIEGARGVVLSITGGTDMPLSEITIAADTVYEVVDPNANIIVGGVIDENMEGKIQVSVIVTGFDDRIQ
jgi:cell division GTPase FtsZ